ncbi:MAG: amino acid adenylation domain-containing protein [Angustibacter sp.]
MHTFQGAPVARRGTSQPLPGRTLVDLLDEQVLARSDDVAITHGEDRVTFAGLAAAARRVGRHLRSLGVGPDSCVGLFAHPSVDLVVGAWGILHAGGAYLPLAPEYPHDRLRYMVEDFGGGLVLTQPELVDTVRGLVPAHTRIVTVDGMAIDGMAIDGMATDTCVVDGRVDGGGIHDVDGGVPRPAPSDLAYVIYTSGSTGAPKGVMVEHRAVVNQMRWLAGTQGIDHHRTILQKTPMSFDAAQWEILASACGSAIVIGPRGVYRDPDALVDTIRAHGVTTLQCVPTLLQALLDTGRMTECGTLTQVFCGGEALSRALAQRFFADLGDRALVNLYGPTECTINSSAYRVDPASLAAGPAAVPIGQPVHNTRYEILDDDRRPVAAGQVGELYIGGAQVARGYLGKPELTRERFVHLHREGGGVTSSHEGGGGTSSHEGGDTAVMYRTGDLVYRDTDGSTVFVGRADNQVKLRGYRVELDEVRLALESHEWVRHAAVVVRDDPRTGFQKLVAFVELNPREAALMDQDRHGAHHQSKASRVQVRAQLSNLGCRQEHELRGMRPVDLPGREPSVQQRCTVFARKTYRFYDGGQLTRQDVLDLFGERAAGSAPRDPADVDPAELGAILRYFGQFHSVSRLLPKYGYASPGSLYATQLYLEVDGLFGLAPGFYYYHPVEHRLYLVRPKAHGRSQRARVHFVGRRRAIEPVYRTNIREVLEIEAGHMVGLFEQVLPAHGLTVRAAAYEPTVIAQLECADEDYYLGAFDVRPCHPAPVEEPVDVYLQAHGEAVPGLPSGLYRLVGEDLLPVGEAVVQRKHVIAINQQAYDRASFGIALVSRTRHEWRAYLELGRVLHRLQATGSGIGSGIGSGAGIGLMSSGYSSASGHDLPAHQRLAELLTRAGLPVGPSYFAIGGRVSPEQVRHRGMKEDSVHMKGPAELVRDDVRAVLPDYMVPNTVLVLDRLPRTANGKIDVRSLSSPDPAEVAGSGGAQDEDQLIEPRTDTERRIAAIWRDVMKTETVSVRSNFFDAGGNSLLAVTLVNRVNAEFGVGVPLQVVFEAPTVEALAEVVDGDTADEVSRLIRLSTSGGVDPVFCWPGLGGYPMSLRMLATRAGRPFYGVQGWGVNEGESVGASIAEMAADDLELIRRQRPHGPYTLWGYSFGARMAFEAAYQLERAGERVEQVVLIAPGNPRAGGLDRTPSWSSRSYLAILFSVFAGTVSGDVVDECLRCTRDQRTFTEFIHARFGLDRGLIRRISEVVARTYRLDYSDADLARRAVTAPVAVLRAQADQPSFIERPAVTAPCVSFVDLPVDHYAVLRVPFVDELVQQISTGSAPAELAPEEGISHAACDDQALSRRPVA